MLPTRSTAQSTKPAAAPTKATKAKALGAKRAKILSIYFPKPPQTKGGKSESAAQKKQAGLVAAYGSLVPQAGGGKTQSAAKKKQTGLASAYGSLARPRPRQQVPSQEALAADRIGIFTVAGTLNNASKQRLREALTPPANPQDSLRGYH